MKIKIGEQLLTGTPEEILREFWDANIHADSFETLDGYIEHMRGYCERVTERPALCRKAGGTKKRKRCFGISPGSARSRFRRMKMEDNRTLYFAYGSNINLDQMAYRCPQAEAVGRAVLEGYALKFRGSGCATVIPQENGKVEGLLWKLTEQCEQSLDFYEGVRSGHYDKAYLTVNMENGEKASALVYVMNRELEKKPTMPSVAYFNGICDGYKQNGLNVRTLVRALRDCQKEVRAARGARNERGR